MTLQEQEELQLQQDLKMTQELKEHQAIAVDRLRALQHLRTLPEWTLVVQDWLSTRPDLEQNLSEALYSEDDKMVREFKMEVFAIKTFEMYLRQTENLGIMSKEALEASEGE